MIKKIHCLKCQKANPKKRGIVLLWHKVPRWTEIPFRFHNWIGWIALCLAFCKIHFGSNLDFSPFDARTLRNITNIMAASVFRRFHAKCVEEVKRLNGAVELGDAYKYQKREN